MTLLINISYVHVSGENITNSSQDEIATSSTSNASHISYASYIEKYKDHSTPTDVVEINAINYADIQGMPSKVLDEYKDIKNCLFTDENGMVTWNFSIKQEGLYNIELFCDIPKGNDGAVSRELKIDDKLLFDEMNIINIQRLWKDATGFLKDSKGNELRPRQVEDEKWQTYNIRDYKGMYAEPYKFYLNAGDHKISIKSIKEPLILKSIKLYNIAPIMNYEEIKKQYLQEKYPSPSGVKIKIDAEKAKFKTDPVIFAQSDNSSSQNDPQTLDKIKFNSIGGYSWRYPGQSITWEFDVPESGLYKIDLRVRQNFSEGNTSYRSFYIDGKIPFDELKSINFNFNYNWFIKELKNKDNTDYLFYLSKGKHEITIENTLGDVKDIVEIVKNSVFELNRIYRKIRMITGTFPDANRDYYINEQIPECTTVFKEQYEKLSKALNDLYTTSGQKGAEYAVMQKLKIQLKDFTENPNTIPSRLDSFSNNINGLANYVMVASEQPLFIDYINITSPDVPSPKEKAGFFQDFTYKLRLFMNSFFIDYSYSDNKANKTENVALWLTSGRDQANVMKDLIDNFFVSDRGTKVDLKLVSGDAILPAVAAGKGPDVAFGQERSLPVNYALRGALYDLTNFSDYKDVLSRFSKGSDTAYWIKQKLYALPETNVFPLMFYRKDVLDELNIKLPKTWDDIYNCFPILQQNYMEVGFPNIIDNDISQYLTFLYQSGGTLFNSDNSKIIMDNEKGIAAFKKWTELYTKYEVPQKQDLLTRFRTGETPIMIAPYTFYNNINATAPEINGLWSVAEVPGTLKEDGTIDHSVVSAGTGSIIFKHTKNKEAAWEVLKWWTSEEVQSLYGKEMESIQGPSARWPSANDKAIEKMSWDKDIFNVIKEQKSFVYGLPEPPGAYIVSRYIGNAIKQSVTGSGDPRDILEYWSKQINQEIDKKSVEFKLK